MKDIFGKALYNYWMGDHRTPCMIRREDGYTDSGSLNIYFTRKFYPIEKSTIPCAKGNVLDVGCGAGRYVLYFQKRGFEVMGIDKSPLAIKVCRERGCKKVRNMDIFNSGLPEKSFDTILLFGGNLGIGGDIPGAINILKISRKLIRESGLLLLTSLDVTKTKKKAHLKYQEQSRKDGKDLGSVKIRIEYKDLIGEWFYWLHIQPKILRKIALECGWRIQEINKHKSGEYSAVLCADGKRTE